ncbi:tetratricopeptide repeat protein [Hyalangium versicolor]|uniref:tetratricopeptide repeat protein n=1 Tax=Hyalangium versicolor TaxID=2861190 RepID=UPI001CCAF624|nr:tetratricopeptide repeat protein [Hyalangium versicolor]
MAYSPTDTPPVLNFEAEEKHFLDQLAHFVEQRRLLLDVAEEGSLAELRRRLSRHSYDIVHLSGHGAMTGKGPRLLMEGETGARHDVSPDQLLEVLRQAPTPPRMVVLASCSTAEQGNGGPSLAAELVHGGIPWVVGWTRPVQDGLARTAVAQLYDRLCHGEGPAQAVARARQSLRAEDSRRPDPGQTHTWASLQYLTTQPAGFALDLSAPPATEESPTREMVYTTLGRRMRVLKEGFVGRRRELQTLGRILWQGHWAAPGQAPHPVAGALVTGMKGQGKSCLVGRAIQRFSQEAGELAMVVFHGKLNAIELLDTFRQEASQAKDLAATALLDDTVLSLPRRLELLLSHHWRKRPMVVVLDDFEQNLEISGQGEARLHTFASELLGALVPACRGAQPKVLLTTTTLFPLPPGCEEALVKVPLGALEKSSINKLLLRELKGDSKLWAELCERLGRNARVLEWTRQLITGKTSSEVRRMLGRTDQELQDWQGKVPDSEKQDELAALFLKHIALEEARTQVGPDAETFVARARVYEVPVPVEALSRLTEGLTVSLGRDLVPLTNLGLLEVGSEEGQEVYRVSPLVKKKFDAPDGQRWHGIAAEFWWKGVKSDTGWYAYALLQAWEHALQARRQDIADAAAGILNPWLHDWGEYSPNLSLGRRHMAFFPESVTGLHWTGHALYRMGDVENGRALLERSIELAERSLAGKEQAPSIVKQRLSACLYELGTVLSAQGELKQARALHRRSLKLRKEAFATENHPVVAASFHELAVVLGALGDWVCARACLERSLKICKQIYGTEVHSSVATSLQMMGALLQAQGDTKEACSHFQRSLELKKLVHGTEIHPSVAASLHALAVALRAEGKLDSARGHLEHSLEIQEQVYGTQFHPSVAASLHALAEVNLLQDDLTTASALLERSLTIKKEVFGTELHPDVAASLHAWGRVRHAQGELVSARNLFKQSLRISRQIYGTENHASVTASLHELARVLQAQGKQASAYILLKRILKIDTHISGTEVHPSVAACYANLGACLVALGRSAEGETMLRKAQELFEHVHGTRDHYKYAEVETSLAILLLSLDREEEALSLLHHARSVLQPKLPNHPLLKRIQHLLSHPRVNLRKLAHLALVARASRTTPPDKLTEGLQVLRDAGPLYTLVADFLEHVACSAPLPPVPAALPKELAELMGSVRTAAEKLPVSKQLAPR